MGSNAMPALPGDPGDPGAPSAPIGSGPGAGSRSAASATATAVCGAWEEDTFLFTDQCDMQWFSCMTERSAFPGVSLADGLAGPRSRG